eukprot:CAMPEP_0117593824 /NCGR_PEP_ID=MMETSP0784-20121206/72851_1 /TAXON_ID=39447 /ORGANISM="" /LENGTH=163 /DNA_ID=CAMNT_0005395797 /DNA_START=101 /DNA_END=593 /DNA_ORIENTATION=+
MRAREGQALTQDKLPLASTQTCCTGAAGKGALSRSPSILGELRDVRLGKASNSHGWSAGVANAKNFCPEPDILSGLLREAGFRMNNSLALTSKTVADEFVETKTMPPLSREAMRIQSNLDEASGNELSLSSAPPPVATSMCAPNFGNGSLARSSAVRSSNSSL